METKEIWPRGRFVKFILGSINMLRELHSMLKKNEGLLRLSSFVMGIVSGVVIISIGRSIYGDGFSVLVLLGIVIFCLGILGPLLRSHFLLFLLTVLIFAFWLIDYLSEPSPFGSLNFLVAFLTWCIFFLTMYFSYTYSCVLVDKARKKRRKKTKK